MKTKLLSVLDSKVQKYYKAYQQKRVRMLESELTKLVSKQKELLRKLEPINKEIQAKQAEIKRLRSAF
jgi:predicted  nucleic acid-binding Zn-ribbon protein